jgi:FkbH-like protein
LIPAITVPELPEDPADYLEYLYTLNLFETTALSTGDAERTNQYRTEARRLTEQQQYPSEDAFLESLDMCSSVEPFNTFNTPRIAQLSNRSNQFNLRTIRYTEADITGISGSTDTFPFAFTLEDRFGDNGLIAVVILKKETADTLFIDTWLMSCRVLKRGMEQFTLNTIARFAKDNGFRYLKGEYLPTAKNVMVKDHYPGLGFREKDKDWILDTFTFEAKTTWIKAKLS